MPERNERDKVFPDSALRYDRYGLPYIITSDEELAYVSPCHNAFVSFSGDGILGCKVCWGEVPGQMSGTPYDEANPTCGRPWPDNTGLRCIRVRGHEGKCFEPG